MEQLIGKTPLVRLSRLEEAYGLQANLYAKVEFFNPTGSVKDRAALGLIEDAERRGVLKKGGVVIEPTSGNTGIGLALVCALRGYRLIIVMPNSMSVERQKLMTAYGAELVLTDGALGMQGAIDKAYALQAEMDGAFIPDQFANGANATAHYLTTGPEIFQDMDGQADIFVCAVGTGGTLTGTARYLKEKNSAVKVVAVEPKNSAILSGGKVGAHKIQGIGAGFVPSVLDVSLIDEVQTVEDGDAFLWAKELCKKEGLLVGVSSGAALKAAIEQAKKQENVGKNIVLILPDGGGRYLSTELFDV
jgi:cysteine synthase A